MLLRATPTHRRTTYSLSAILLKTCRIYYCRFIKSQWVGMQRMSVLFSSALIVWKIGTKCWFASRISQMLPKEFNVQLTVEDSPLDDRTVSIPPEKTQSVLFSGDPSGLEEKVISVHLGIEDDLLLDNSAAAILSGVSPLRILLVSDNQKSLLPELLSSYGKRMDLDVVVPADYPRDWQCGCSDFRWQYPCRTRGFQ